MKKKVAFICVHNSCRSQIAEALGKHFAADVFESYSAGTQIKKQINSKAILLMKEVYEIDMEKTQYPKLLEALPEIDIVVTMGCNVSCPSISCQHREDWGLEDPSNKNEQVFKASIQLIENKIFDLMKRIQEKRI